MISLFDSMYLPVRRDSIGCLHRVGDTSGDTYDANGKVCASLTSEQKAYIVAGSCFCAAVLLVLAGIFIRRYFRLKSKVKHSDTVPERPMSSLGSPLIKRGRGQSYFQGSQRAASLMSVPKPNLSPLSTSSEFQRLDASSSSSHYSNPSASGSLSPNLYSPYSPNPENFAFPILSADGRLLPPPPASSRHSFVDISEADAMERPLPPAPVSSVVHAYPVVPAPPQRWSYSPARAHSPSIEKDLGAHHVGLYPGLSRDEGSIELLRDDLDLESVPRGASPRVAHVNYMHRPQSAIYHQTFSAEGEDLGDYDYGSEESHRGY